jgi:hypothetical protein
MPRCPDLAIFVLTTDNRQTDTHTHTHKNRFLYPLLRMRARGIKIAWPPDLPRGYVLMHMHSCPPPTHTQNSHIATLAGDNF